MSKEEKRGDDVKKGKKKTPQKTCPATTFVMFIVIWLERGGGITALPRDAAQTQQKRSTIAQNLQLTIISVYR